MKIPAILLLCASRLDAHPTPPRELALSIAEKALDPLLNVATPSVRAKIGATSDQLLNVATPLVRAPMSTKGAKQLNTRIFAKHFDIAHEKIGLVNEKILGPVSADKNNAYFVKKGKDIYVKKYVGTPDEAGRELFTGLLAQAVLKKTPETHIGPKNDHGEWPIYSKVFKGSGTSKSDAITLNDFLVDENGDQTANVINEKIVDTFLDTLFFKVITGDADIKLANMMIIRNEVFPIDGGEAFQVGIHTEYSQSGIANNGVNIEDKIGQLLSGLKEKDIGEVRLALSELFNVDEDGVAKLSEKILQIGHDGVAERVSNLITKVVENDYANYYKAVDSAKQQILKQGANPEELDNLLSRNFGDGGNYYNGIAKNMEMLAVLIAHE